MVTLTQSAQKACEFHWPNGNTVTLWLDLNCNTHEARVYQRCDFAPYGSGKLTRHTGKNIIKLMAEVDAADAKGELTWIYTNAGAMAYIRSWIEHLVDSMPKPREKWYTKARREHEQKIADKVEG